MAKINDTTTITLEEAADMIAAVGHEVTFLLEGEPGIGKTAMGKTLGERFAGRKVIYFDCTTKDLGDIMYPDVRTYQKNGEEKKVLHFIPNAQLGVHLDEPVIIILDELGKCSSRAVLNAIMPIIHERRAGEDYLHPESIVLATTNLSTDGVGDIIPAHMRNRLASVRIMKPSYREWLGWARKNNISPMVTAYVEMYPDCLASYLDPNQKDNPRIYHPERQQIAYVSPRSLEKASHVVRGSSKMSRNALTAAMAGLGGEAFAREMQDFLAVQGQLPTLSEVRADPEKAKLPTTDAAAMVLIHGMIQKIDKGNFDPLFTYVQRLTKEVQAIFYTAIVADPALVVLGAQKEIFRQWGVENSYMF